MGMEHKCFLFDTVNFNKELREIIILSGETNNSDVLIKFINSNLSKICSPYTGESLTVDWEDELENGSIQELCDFAMTKYYSPDEEDGLSYAWDALLESLRNLTMNFKTEIYILGSPLESESFIFDPGGMGLGFVYLEDIPVIYSELVGLKQCFMENCLTSLSNVLYEIDETELIHAYDKLVFIYKTAKEMERGLLITF